MLTEMTGGRTEGWNDGQADNSVRVGGGGGGGGGGGVNNHELSVHIFTIMSICWQK